MPSRWLGQNSLCLMGDSLDELAHQPSRNDGGNLGLQGVLDSRMVVTFINHQGGVRSRPLHRLASHHLLWAQKNLCLLRAVHVPGSSNIGADILSRGGPPMGEWRVHPQTVNTIWCTFGHADVDLFATKENSHCQTYF